MTSAADIPERTHTLAECNVQYLEQGAALLGELSNAEYGDPLLPAFSQGIGPHVRHIIDHYTTFLEGVGSGRVDYDARERDPLIETDRDVAITRLLELAAQLRLLPDGEGDRMLEVIIDCGTGDAEARQPTRTSVARELQFLLSHTVHHYALLAAALTLRGKVVPAELGMAPSTLRYQKSAK
ncbi:MAG: DinB family protein [Pseudomonadota bacterium]